MLADEFIQAHAERLNGNFKKHGAPFVVNCGRPDKGKKVQETFYRVSAGCIADVPKMYWVSEKDVTKYLDRNKLPSLNKMRRGETAIVKVEQKKETPKAEPKPEKKETPKAEPKPKEAWEMTKEEFSNSIVQSNCFSKGKYSKFFAISKSFVKNGGDKKDQNKCFELKGLAKRDYPDKYSEAVSYHHEREVLNAYQDGKPVPARVLAEYPELKETPKAEPKPKVVKKGNIAMGKAIEIETSSEVIAGHYAAMPLSMLVASHNFANFNRNAAYPDGCQEREYHSTKQLQLNVLNRAKNLKPMHLLNEDLTAESGPPVVNRDGTVLGGNSRTMILQNVKENYYDNWTAYQRELKSRLAMYGLDRDAVDALPAPVLVRLVDVDLNRCRHYSHILNTSTKNEEDASVKSMSYAKEIDEKAIREIGEYLAESEANTLTDIFTINLIKQKLQKVLREAGVINDTNVSKWIDKDNNFTTEAKNIIETMLVGVVLQDKKLIESAKSYTDKIIRGIPYLLRIKGLSGKWNIIKHFENAIRFESDRRGKNMPKSQFVKTDNVFGDNPTELDVLVWDVLDLKPNEFKKAIKKYAEVATEQSKDDDPMFGRVELEPKQLLQDILNKKLRLDDRKPSGKSRLSDGSSKPQRRDTSIFRSIGKAISNDPIVKFMKKLGK